MLTNDLIKLNNLQLAAKLVSEELKFGIHGSKRTGAGVEFEQFRNYNPGDDPKSIDWKLFARTEKYLIKESSSESNLKIRFVLDLSGSMNYAEKDISRLAYCKILFASLAYIGNLQNDHLYFYTLKNDKLQAEVTSGSRAFHQMIYALENAEADGKWRNKTSNFPEFQQNQNELLILATDLLQVDEEWINLIKNLANSRREIIIFQVLGNIELDFDLKGYYRFQDLETNKQIEGQAETLKETYIKNRNNYMQYLAESLKIEHVNWIKTTLDQSIASVILDSFQIKNRMSK